MNFNRFLLIQAFLILLSVIRVEAYTETFYLRANGNGNAPKTIEGAFGVNDFNNASNWGADDKNDGKIGPNDRVVVLDDDGVFSPASPGLRNSNFLIIRGSGLAGKPITIQGEDGGNPILLGSLSKNASADWTNEPGDLWKTANGSFLVDPGFVLVGSESQANVAIREIVKGDLTADREWWYDSTNECVYLYNDGGNPATEHGSIEIPAVDRIIFSDKKNYIAVKDITIKYSARNGFWIESPDNWLIDSCTVKFGGGHYKFDNLCDGNAIAYYRGATNSVVSNCSVSQWQDIGVVLEVGYSTDNASNITFSNNTIDKCGGGIAAQIVSAEICSINTVLISGNTVTDSNAGWSNGGSCPSRESGYSIRCAATANGTTSGVTISDNDLSGFGGSGIDLRGGSNYTVTRNKIYDGNRSYTDLYVVGGIKARGDTVSVTGNIYYNLIYNNDVPGIYIYGNDATLKIYNNTVYNCGGLVRPYSDTGVRFTNSDQFKFKNNIVYAKSGSFSALHVNRSVPIGSLEYNMYYKDAGDLILYPWKTTYSVGQFANYQAAITNEAHSKISDPLLTDPANKVFTLQSKSPAIEAGVNVGLISDFKGNPIVGQPEIGAYEYQPNPPDPPKNLNRK